MPQVSPWLTVNYFSNRFSECAYAPNVMKRASSTQIKQFAQKMVHNHTQINKDLLVLARSKGIKLTHYVPEEEQTIIDRIGQLKGGAFDAAYQNEMVRDHTKGINHMEREISLGTDPQIRSYAAKYLPLLRHHLQIIQGVDVSIGRGAASEIVMPPTSTGNGSQTRAGDSRCRCAIGDVF